MPTTDAQITWTISLDQANLMMSIVSDQKFSLVADLIVTLRQQAATKLQQIQAQQSAQMADDDAATVAGAEGQWTGCTGVNPC